MMNFFYQLELNLNSRLNQLSLSSSSHSPVATTSNLKQEVSTEKYHGSSPQIPLSNPTLKTFPPLGKTVKLKWPTYSGDHSHFESWKHQFLAVLCASELAALFDRISDNLIN